MPWAQSRLSIFVNQASYLSPLTSFGSSTFPSLPFPLLPLPLSTLSYPTRPPKPSHPLALALYLQLTTLALHLFCFSSLALAQAVQICLQFSFLISKNYTHLQIFQILLIFKYYVIYFYYVFQRTISFSSRSYF